jgi:hypothetical protein
MGNTVDILDLTVYKGEQFTQTHKLDIKLFQKPFNKYLYLPMTSYHRITTFTSFITSELKRYRISCTDNESFNTIKQQFTERLLSRGYTAEFLEPLLHIELNRDTIIQQYKDRQHNKLNQNNHNLNNSSITNTNNTQISFCTTNTPRQRKIKLKQCLAYDDFIYADPNSEYIFGHNKSPLITYKRTQNIGDIITESKYNFVIGQTSE